MNGYSFFQNRKCEYFPCHKAVAEDDFNCLFCYCPLYALADRCGGDFCYTKEGIKDCSACIRPHIRVNYEKILSRMDAVMEMAKNRADREETA